MVSYLRQVMRLANASGDIFGDLPTPEAILRAAREEADNEGLFKGQKGVKGDNGAGTGQSGTSSGASGTGGDPGGGAPSKGGGGSPSTGGKGENVDAAKKKADEEAAAKFRPQGLPSLGQPLQKDINTESYVSKAHTKKMQDYTDLFLSQVKVFDPEKIMDWLLKKEKETGNEWIVMVRGVDGYVYAGTSSWKSHVYPPPPFFRADGNIILFHNHPSQTSGLSLPDIKCCLHPHTYQTAIVAVIESRVGSGAIMSRELKHLLDHQIFPGQREAFLRSMKSSITRLYNAIIKYENEQFKKTWDSTWLPRFWR